MAHAVAASTGAQFDGTNTVLTYDVLVADPSLPYGGSTYIAADATVDIVNTSREDIEATIIAQIIQDIEDQLNFTLDPSEVLVPARAKG